MATHGLPTWPWQAAPIDTLPPAEALLVEGMRLWGEAARLGHPALPAARLPLVTEEVGAAAPALDAVLRAGGDRFALSGPLAPRLGGDEPALLLAFSLAQRGPRREALAAFLRLLPPAPAYGATGAALSLACIFRRAGLLLTNPLR
ncbi:hypothetical protein E0493_20765 [Roseomonas sp. M0104]|uniref:Uncharacterized protein n=1 Tax=Teichococcus coralli TaxID=2545983 RepID=A0A845BKI7_9PROT|nr:hypothetical protein [Pseudoroseomonas coralli]MXP65787.1 hypothetical protein [Pseudoroseomonas coralli]